MLQTRPSSTSGMMSSQSHANHQFMDSAPQPARSSYQGTGSSGYRGNNAPVQPYAFTSTPNLNQNVPWQQYGAYRTTLPAAGAGGHSYDPSSGYRAPLPGGPSASNVAYSHSFGVGRGVSRDDSVLSTNRNMTTTSRSQSFLAVNPQPSFASGAPSRNTLDRYRRPSGGNNHGRSQSSTLPSTISMVNNQQLYAMSAGNQRYSAPNFPANRGLAAVSSFDDMHIHNRSFQDEGKRMLRHSMHTFDLSDASKANSDATRTEKDSKSPRVGSNATTHSRSGSSESDSSTRSSHSRQSSVSLVAEYGPVSQERCMQRVLTEIAVVQITNRTAPVSTRNPSSAVSDDATSKAEQAKLVNIPPRGSSSDATKRTLSPSPLSKPVAMAHEASEDPSLASTGVAKANSPAAKQLAAINQKGGRAKSKTSRLRRAFSFGSAADFRKATGGEENGVEKPDSSMLHKEPTSDEAYDAEQARIAEAQEAAGIGSSIYGGRFFVSTDNLSISSTASSASIMIRKMGRGMKKSTRSLVGLFRPKSVSGFPAPERVSQDSSQPAVSMITVEAETQRVNVTADLSLANGGIGFPHLERNSLDAAQVPEMASERLGSSGTDQSASRKSILGGDKERAEVLAAVRKGILKRLSPNSLPPA